MQPRSAQVSALPRPLDSVCLDSPGPTHFPNGVVVARDQQRLATRITLPAGSYLLAPVVIECPLLGPSTATVEGLPDLRFPVERRGDQLVVDLDPSGWPLTFDLTTHDYSIGSRVEPDDGLEYVRRRHTVHADGSMTHTFDEHVRRGAGGRVEARAGVEVHCDAAGVPLEAARVLERAGQEPARSALLATPVDVGGGVTDILVQSASLTGHLKTSGWKGFGHWLRGGKVVWAYTSVNPDPRKQFPGLRWALRDPDAAARLLASTAEVAPAVGPESPFKEQLKVEILEDSVRVGAVSLKKRKL